MTVGIMALVLFAALLHASWNAAVKGGADRFRAMTLMCLAVAAICAVGVVLLPMPARASWICIALSAALHVGYNLFLLAAYRSGDFGATYPVARGSSPLLVTLGAALFAGEMPAAGALAGILLVSGGILSLAFRGRRLPEKNLLYATGTGVFIAAYSVTDGLGVRLSGNAAAYTVWLCLFWGISLLPFFCRMARLARAGGRRPRMAPRFRGRRRIASRLWHRVVRHDP